MTVSLQNRYFRLETMYTPNILVNKVLDYDVIQQVKLILYAQVCEINLNLNVLKVIS